MPCGDLPIWSKIVVVTGGGSGINLSFVKLAVESGARGVIIGDLKLNDEAQRVVKKSATVVFSKCDVSRRADLEQLIKVSLEKFDDVPDIYIAGAGVFEPAWSNWWADTEDDRYAELDINVTGALKFSRIAMRSLLAKKKKGAILITASLAGYAGTFAAPLYCASKHAVIGFVRSMADLDTLESIKVVAVAPGLVDTPLWTDRPDTMHQFGYSKEAAVTPAFVAEKMLDLVSKSEYKGGSCLEVSASTVRTLGTWGIPAPAYAGTQIPQEALDASYAPLKEIMEKDRQSKL